MHPVPTQKFESVWDALPVEVGPKGETEVAQVAPPQFAGQLSGERPQAKSFAAGTAAVTGESKAQVNRHIVRAEALGDDLDRLAGTSLDKGVELDALKAMPEPERKELIERAVAGEVVTARTPAAPTPHPQPASESPADFMQRYALEMRLALGSAMRALGCIARGPRRVWLQAGESQPVPLRTSTQQPRTHRPIPTGG